MNSGNALTAVRDLSAKLEHFSSDSDVMIIQALAQTEAHQLKVWILPDNQDTTTKAAEASQPKFYLFNHRKIHHRQKPLFCTAVFPKLRGKRNTTVKSSKRKALNL